MSVSCREAFPDVREWSRCPSGCPLVVARPSQMVGKPSLMYGSSRVALPDVREWSGGPP